MPPASRYGARCYICALSRGDVNVAARHARRARVYDGSMRLCACRHAFSPFIAAALFAIATFFQFRCLRFLRRHFAFHYAMPLFDISLFASSITMPATPSLPDIAFDTRHADALRLPPRYQIDVLRFATTLFAFHAPLFYASLRYLFQPLLLLFIDKSADAMRFYLLCQRAARRHTHHMI